jgi:hypothetical protein
MTPPSSPDTAYVFSIRPSVAWTTLTESESGLAT